MKKILLNGVDGNFGSKAAKVLLEKWPHEDLIFAAPSEKGLEKYADIDVEKRVQISTILKDWYRLLLV